MQSPASEDATGTSTTTAEQPPVDGARSSSTERIPLDRLMLAMDVVDTMRHQQQLVAAELDEDARQQDFTQRVQQIYEAQGIEVDEDIIAQAVEALREDRFVYQPPQRSFAVRLAEMYVERGKWALRLGVMALLGLVLWASYAIPAHFHREGQIAEFQSRLSDTLQRIEQLQMRARQLQTRSTQPQPTEDPPAIAGQLAIAAEQLEASMTEVGLVRAALTPPPEADSYPENKEEWDQTIELQQQTLTEAEGGLGEAQDLLDNVAQLRKLGPWLQAALAPLEALELTPSERRATDNLAERVRVAMADGDAPAAETELASLRSKVRQIQNTRQQQAEIRTQFAQLAEALTGVEVESEAAEEVERLHSSIEQAIGSNNWKLAGSRLGELQSLIALLDREYELRITRKGRSGVWRHPNNNRQGRNYYIIVEATDKAGNRVKLPIKSEEDGRVRSVSKFGVRVPSEVYERIKADKLDNGIVDQRDFGAKRRGRKATEYRFDTQGGMITRW